MTPKPCPFCGAQLVATRAGEWVHPRESVCWLAAYLISSNLLPSWNRRVP